MTPTRGTTDLSGTPAPPSKDNGTGWLFYLLLATQTVGATMIYVISIPLYRRLIAEPGGEGGKEEVVWSLLAIVLMQAAYWCRHRIVPELPRVLPNAPFGHAVLLLGHLVFDVAVIFFTFMFIAHPPEFQRALLNYAITIAGIFALFCYSLELERLGKAFQGRTSG